MKKWIVLVVSMIPVRGVSSFYQSVYVRRLFRGFYVEKISTVVVKRDDTYSIFDYEYLRCLQKLSLSSLNLVPYQRNQAFH